MLPLIHDLQERPGDRPELALRLWIIAVVLAVIFLATMLNAALPARLLDPRWLQRMIQALLDRAFLPLIALVLLQLAVVLHPASTRLRRRRDRYSHLSRLAAVGFLLLIPLQIASSWGTLNLLASGQQQQRLQGVAMVGALRQAVNTSSSHEELEQRLRNLPVKLNNPGSRADLALPFRERQRRILAGLDRSEQQLARASGPAPIPWLPLLESSLRVVPTALALAAGFAVMALGAGQPRSRLAAEEQAYFEALGSERVEG